MVLEKLIELLCEQLDIEADEVNENTDIVNDLGADSLDVVDLVMTLEDEFDIEIPDEDIRRMIAESYDLVTYSPTKRIYEAVKRIPKGCVATYGQVAAMAGEPKMARAVGNALHKNPDPEHIPCYRVVNSKGELSGAFAFGGAEEQANRLRADGIAVIDNRVDLVKYGMKL